MGIGPEVTLRALANVRGSPSSVIVMGRYEPNMVRSLEDEIGLSVRQLSETQYIGCQPSDCQGINEAQIINMLNAGLDEDSPEVWAIRCAADLCLRGHASAMVTGPIHKKQLVDHGFAFKGHTDFLGNLCGVDDPVMAFVGGPFKVSLVTHHQPLMTVAAALTFEKIYRAVSLSYDALRTDLNVSQPRLAVCGLNPHAGEGGMLGTEERELIEPVCEQLRRDGIPIEGPMSAETAFIEAHKGQVDLVVAMYHDQGLLPIKAVGFGKSVNWTLGLPIIRTSVDHGTACQLVGTGRADPSSMVAAIELACRIADRREATSKSISEDTQD